MISRLWASSSRSVCHNIHCSSVCRPLGLHRYDLRSQRFASTIGKALTPSEINDLLSKSTWSVASLIERDSTAEPEDTISQKQLHHLLRLSALPLPESPGEEAEMIKTLQSQLHFVKAIQSVDTSGIEPLQAIRDETEESRQANEFTVESLKDEFAQEEIKGFARRIREKPGDGTQKHEEVFDALKLAPNKIGRYVRLNVKKS